MNLFIDFETRSEVDLKKCGVDVYARHPSTDILCIAWAVDDGPVHIWTAGHIAGTPDSPSFKAFVFLMDAVFRRETVVAHNAAFELAIWEHVGRKKYGWPELLASQCDCTMARSYAMALPGALANAAPALGLTIQKDTEGHRVMMKLSQPKLDGTFYEPFEEPALFQKLYDYCKQDVEVERELFKRLLPLSPYEKRLWVLDQKINSKGIQIDIPAVKTAIKIAEVAKAGFNVKMQAITDGKVATFSASQQLKDWLSTKGFPVESIDKLHVSDLLENKELPSEVREALLLRQAAAKSSTAKLEAMLNGVCDDGRIRGMFQFTAAATRRWAGRRLQVHNLPRPKLKQKQIDGIFELLRAGNPVLAAETIDLFYGPVLNCLSDCLRGFLIPAPGHDFIAADFSNVEGRVLAWLAGEEWKLKAFDDFDKGIGPELYRLMAAAIYSVALNQVTDEQRQIGKVAELALGFGGGVGAFQAMAKGYGVKVADKIAEATKVAWRGKHPNIVAFWYKLEKAAIAAVMNPGQTFMAGALGREIRYRVVGSFLCCQLPSKGVLFYPYPKIAQQVWATFVSTDGKEKITRGTFHGPNVEAARAAVMAHSLEKKILVKEISEPSGVLSFMGVDSNTNTWMRFQTYGGSLAENVTQAASRDLLADRLLVLDEANYPISIHIHDEGVPEVPKGFGSLAEVEKIMGTLPAWAKGLPLVAKGWRGERYRK